MQHSLFNEDSHHVEHVPLIIAGQTVAMLDYYPSLFSQQGQAWFDQLLVEIPWQQDQITIAGKVMDIPRLQCWMGEPTAYYQYSGIPLEPQAWSPLLLEIKQQVEQHCGQRFNSALINRYRNGEDSVSWHADDEAELGDNPVVASVSFGQPRQFSMKLQNKTKKVFLKNNGETGKNNASSARFDILLNHGSLLIMGAGVQEHYLHSVLKDRNMHTERINITFRKIVPLP